MIVNFSPHCNCASPRAQKYQITKAFLLQPTATAATTIVLSLQPVANVHDRLFSNSAGMVPQNR